MVPAARWLVVAALAVGLSSAPALLRAIPAHQTSVTATELATRIRSSADVGWSGEVRTLGTLGVPVSGTAFSDLARLLGESNQMRVWWRSAERWRIDRIYPTGETDTGRDGPFSQRWRYESRRLTVTPYSDIRLPDDVDALPPTLARRMLSGARADELSRLPARRIAGRSAAGVRLEPSDARSTIRRVQVWADEETGLPLRVEVYARARQALLVTAMGSLDLDRPSTAEAAMHRPAGVELRESAALDAVAGANVFAPFRPPDRLIGLPRLGDRFELGAVGVYGRGPTAVLALPLRHFVADELRRQIRKSKDARETSRSIALEVGPMSVLLTRAGGGRFLLIGTVDPASLEMAARRLDDGIPQVDR